jgi:hypothetical protein
LPGLCFRTVAEVSVVLDEIGHAFPFMVVNSVCALPGPFGSGSAPFDNQEHLGHLNAQGISTPTKGAAITTIPPMIVTAAAIPIKTTTVAGTTLIAVLIARSCSLLSHCLIDWAKLKISQPLPIAKSG